MKKLLLSLSAITLGIGAISPFTNVNAERFDGELNETVFTVDYDFNGGATYEGQSTFSRESVSLAPALSNDTLIDCFYRDPATDTCHSLEVEEGKTLSYVTVNGERHNLEEGDGYMLAQDTIIVYYWENSEEDASEEPIDEEKPIEYQKSTEDENGNSIAFNDDGEHEYTLYLESINFNMTDEELSEFGLTREEYEAGKAMYIEAVSDEGEIISVLNIDVCDEDDRCVLDGPFEIRIKLTDEMKGYDNYKLIYINDEEAEITTEEPIALTVEDGFLVGTLPHLSSYALVGSNDNNTPAAPDTGESQTASDLVVTFALPVISTFVLASLATAIILSKHSRKE